MKEAIVDLLAQQLSSSLPRDEIARLIEIPPSEELGDFAFPCFPLARIMRKSPAAIAEDLKKKMEGIPFLEKMTAVAGYLNFFIDKKTMAEKVVAKASADVFGRRTIARRVVVEFASPNTNKPLHLGHLRNIAIGEATGRILSFCGNSVVRTSINNDRGVHICKSMLAYAEFGNAATPEKAGKKSDHFVGDYYVFSIKKPRKTNRGTRKPRNFC